MAFKGFKKSDDQAQVNHFEAITNDSKQTEPVKKEDDEGTTRQNSVYEVPKKWHRLIAESSGASFSSYAKLAIREKLIKDGLL